jgi:hypothetical protein
VHPRPSRSVPVAVLSCCTRERRWLPRLPGTAWGLHHRRGLRPGRTVPQSGRRERTRHHRHQRASRMLKRAAPRTR